ncbi:MAG: cytochrome ubiquinol oxidase subunit I, partial [Candidatus Eremiobacteraeota bacterium]|nr:cytochrome ubiquinol oxidase subunit I [Candidatus Eremiobacteraeota bacterium]
AIEIPGGLSVLVAFDPGAEVTGLDRVAPDDRPPVAATHYSFDTMVGCATLLLLVAAAWLVVTLRRGVPAPWLLAALAVCGPLAVAAMEAGWFTTEFGRQPWVARGLLRTTDAVTIAPGLDVQFYGFTVLYVILAATCWWLLRRVGANDPEPARDASAAPQASAS